MKLVFFFIRDHLTAYWHSVKVQHLQPTSVHLEKKQVIIINNNMRT